MCYENDLSCMLNKILQVIVLGEKALLVHSLVKITFFINECSRKREKRREEKVENVLYDAMNGGDFYAALFTRHELHFNVFGREFLMGNS